MKWEPTTVKAQLRLASQRLGQVQAKNDSQANITYTDIATLIQRGNVSLAREKAEKLVMDEAYGDLLEELELQIGVALEHFAELERGVPSPGLIEATSTIIFAAPHIHTKDLDTVKTILVQRLGIDFARSASGNRDNHVSRRVLKAISPSIPSVIQLDAYMQDIASSHGVSWTPDPSRQSIVNVISEMLDPLSGPEVDLPRLRDTCRNGISDEPSWLRPRIWKLLLATVPPVKGSWKAETTKQREAYYDLVRRLLEPISLSTGNSTSDEIVLEIYKQLSGLPKDIFSMIEDEPEIFLQCPLSEDAPEDIRIPFARALEVRLKVLQDQEQQLQTSENHLGQAEDITPGISLTSSDSSSSDHLNTSTTLLQSRKRIFGTAHPHHCSALLRLVYLHNIVNPGNLSFHTPSLLIPLYSVLLQEVDADDLPHVEADSFWLLEAMVAEFAGLEDDEGTVWMKKISDRLSWADFEFKLQLEESGLDPALPHYSYRWLMPMLTHTLPLPSLFLVWDALFSRPQRERNSYPKLEHLVDVCTSMLIRAKPHLLRVRRARQNDLSLWLDERQPSLAQGETQDGFMEALAFLQKYNPKSVGGTDRIVQTASELAQRREQEFSNANQPTLSLGARFNMWRGLTPQTQATVTPSVEPRKRTNNYPDRDETIGMPKATQTTLASSITNTLWRGFTNQTAMEDELPSTPPSPSPEASPRIPPSSANETHTRIKSLANGGSSNIWGYAEKLKSSDTVANISKVSSNLRAKAMVGSWSSNVPSASNIKEKEVEVKLEAPLNGSRRSSSLSFLTSPGLLSPPPVPPKTPRTPSPLSLSPPSSTGLLEKTKNMISIRSAPVTSTPKSAPKPLLLNSSNPIIASQRKSSHPRPTSTTSTMSTPDTDEWADVMVAKRQHFHRDSLSSVSSLSPSDAFGRVPKSTKSEYESDTGTSRIVALNRRSISPMAPSFRVAVGRSLSRPTSRGSSVSSDFHDVENPPVPPVPPLPPNLARSPLQVSAAVEIQPFVVAPEIREAENSDATSNEMPGPTRKLSWNKQQTQTDSENTPPAATVNLAKSPRVRPKRQPRPANIQIQESPHSRISAEQKSPNPSNLTVAWPGDEQENITTPRAANFDSDDYISASPSLPKSPRRSRKMSSTDQDKSRKSSIDTIMNEERPRKVSTGHRVRKVSTGSREVPRSHRDSAAEEGDDEGYDELLSAYESEEGHTGPYLR